MVRLLTRVLLAIVVVALVLAKVLLHRGMHRMERSGRDFIEQHPARLVVRNGIRQVRTGNPDGPTLVFLHGSPGHWSNWSALLADPDLRDRFYLIAVDRPGYGGSGSGETEASMSVQAERLLESVSDRRGIQVWVGHSFGAPIAARAAMDHPDRVHGVCLLAGAMNPDWEQPRWFHHLGDTGIARWYLPGELVVCNQECLAFGDELADMSSEWATLPMPVLIMHGTRDRLATYEHATWTRDRLTGAAARLVPLEDADHFIIWNHSAEIADELTRLVVDALDYRSTRKGVDPASP